MDKDERYGQDGLSHRIRTQKMGRPVCFYERIGSTNVKAKEAAEKGAGSGTLIVADMQTAGRGRRGRAWESPAGINIYFSLILKPGFAPDKASMLTLVMALAVARGIELTIRGTFGHEQGGELDACQPQIKWPNDIVINGKKVCGILTEMSVKENRISHVVIGVGINVHRQEFPTELVDKATSLEAECGQRLSRGELLANVMGAFEEYYRLFEGRESLADLRETYNGMLVNRDREVCILDPKGEYRGIARGITDTGELCVELPDGSATCVYAGEVSVRGVYGYV